MPAIHLKVKWEHGSGDLVSYKRAPEDWFLRCRILGTDRYQSQRIPGVTTSEQAQQAACSVYVDLIQPRLLVNNQETTSAGSGGGKSFSINVTTTKNSKSHSRGTEGAINEFLRQLTDQYETEQISWGFWSARYKHIDIHLRTYFKWRGITQTREINPTTFDDYLKFRARTAKSKLTTNSELKSIKAFLRNYLLKHRLIEPDLLLHPNLLPVRKVYESDLTANPAINEDDWRLFTDELHRFVKQGERHTNWRVGYYRNLFWSFCMVMKNTGIRPCELLRLKWKHMEFDTEIEPDGSHREIAHIFLPAPITKTGVAREVPTSGRGGDRLSAWLKYQYEYCEKRGFRKPRMDDLVFGQPHLDWKPPNYYLFNRSWGNIRTEISHLLKGHKYSDKPYTIYSMRSTFIEDRLMDDCDAWLVARWCGHDVKTLMKHYERMNVRSKAKEATRLPYGKTKQVVGYLTMNEKLKSLYS